MVPHHGESAKAANDNLRETLHADVNMTIDDTVNHVYEIMLNGEDLMELRESVAANDNDVEEIKLAA